MALVVGTQQNLSNLYSLDIYAPASFTNIRHGWKCFFQESVSYIIIPKLKLNFEIFIVSVQDMFESSNKTRNNKKTKLSFFSFSFVPSWPGNIKLFTAVIYVVTR